MDKSDMKKYIKARQYEGVFRAIVFIVLVINTILIFDRIFEFWQLNVVATLGCSTLFLAIGFANSWLSGTTEKDILDLLKKQIDSNPESLSAYIGEVNK